MPGHSVILADRLTAVTSPVAAFAGLTVGLLVLKMIRLLRFAHVQEPRVATALVLAPPPKATGGTARSQADGGLPAQPGWADDMTGHVSGMESRAGLLRDASVIYRDAAARGERLSQRTLARQLRGHGHRFPNEHLRWISDSIGLTADSAA